MTTSTLDLTNFRCWKKKTFTFPDTGLVLLSGVSGSGKSSILNAIYFVLYGVGTKIITTGEKKCKVTLRIQGFDITRTKAPNRLFLSIIKEEKEEEIKEEEEIYEDEVAQHIIDKKFGKKFTITSYITQKMAQSFLNMGPSDKMGFLEQLALGEENIGEIKKKTKGKVRERKDILIQKISQTEVISREVLLMIKPEEIKFPLVGKSSQIKIKNEAIYWKRTRKEIKKLRDEKNNLESLFNKQQIKIALKDKQQTIIITQDEKIKIIQSEIDSLCSRYDGDENLETLKETLVFLKNKREYTIINERYIDEKINFQILYDQEMENFKVEKTRLQDELDNKSPISDTELSSLGDVINNLKEEKELKYHLTLLYQNVSLHTKTDQELKDEISRCEEKISNFQIDKLNIEQRTTIKSCPCCNSSLIIQDGNLVSAKGNPIDKKQAKLDISNIVKNITNQKKEIEKISKEVILLSALDKQLRKLKNDVDIKSRKIKELTKRYNSIDLNILSDTFDELKEIKVYRSRLENEIEKISNKISKKELSYTLKKLETQLNMRRKEVEKLKIKIGIENSSERDGDISESSETDYTEEELRDEISSQLLLKQQVTILNKQLKDFTNQLDIARRELDKINISSFSDDYETKIKEIIYSIIKLEEKDKQHKKIDFEIQEYQEYLFKLKEYLKWDTKLQLCKTEETLSRKLLAMTELFLNKILEAESIAISQTIDNINYYMNFYLEKFFLDNPITVQITPYKETKKDIKPLINIEVGYKGSNTDLNSLSGGEYDRVTLSIVLALNTIFGSNLLMLDESIVSLDSDLTNEILDVLKENLKEKLVIVVAHQIEEGVFDNVIKIEQPEY
jgi:exonuclease SbcC